MKTSLSFLRGAELWLEAQQDIVRGCSRADCFRAIGAWGRVWVSAASSVKVVIPFPWTGLSFFFSLPYFLLLAPLAAT